MCGRAWCDLHALPHFEGRGQGSEVSFGGHSSLLVANCPPPPSCAPPQVYNEIETAYISFNAANITK